MSRLILTLVTAFMANPAEVRAYNGCISPAEVSFHNGIMKGESTTTLLLRHLHFFGQEVTSAAETLVTDLASSSPIQAMQWAETVLSQVEKGGDLSLYGMLAAGVTSGLSIAPTHQHTKSVNEGIEPRNLPWVYLTASLYRAQKPFPKSQAGTMAARFGHLFSQQATPEELFELREYVRTGMTSPTLNMEQSHELPFLLAAYINQVPDADLLRELWETRSEPTRLTVMILLRNVQCEELADLAVEFAIDTWEDPERFKATLLQPEPPEYGLPFRGFAVRALTEYAERPTARHYIFQKINEDPFYFFPYEETIFRRVLRKFPYQGHELEIVMVVRQILSRNYEVFQLQSE